MEPKGYIIKCRGIIFDGEKVLLARHHKSQDFLAFLGGHLEDNETPEICVKRELKEELGIDPEVGNLIYINQYIDNDHDYLEFFFEIKNADEYLDLNNLNGKSKDSITEIVWVSKNDTIKVLPERIFSDIKSGNFPLNNNVIFIKS